MHEGIEVILKALPAAQNPFEGSEYPMPVSQAILGRMPDIDELKKRLENAKDDELEKALLPVAIAAEVIESNAKDRGDYFLNDNLVRGYVFSGGKNRAGWILTAGDGITDELVKRLKDHAYMIFAAGHKEHRHRPLPERETAGVYYLQLMVRYAMIWGQIEPGNDHEMGHFLEEDMPGAMVVKGKVTPAESLVLLSLMYMGCPAVVDRDFPHDMGPRSVAENDDEILQAVAGFPNMRIRIVNGEQIALPDGAGSTFSREKVEPARTIKGFFLLRPGRKGAGKTTTGDPQTDEAAITVEVEDPKLDLPISAFLEAQARDMGSYLKGVHVHAGGDGALRIDLAEKTPFDPDLLAETIRLGLRRRYPNLGPVHVTVAMGKGEAGEATKASAEFRKRRDEAILKESEENVEEFHACISCQPFSHRHVCIITPDHPPMCGKNRNAIKASALWGSDYRPWTRREVNGDPIQYVVPKEGPIDERAGEWESVNRAASELSGGKVTKVRIHAVCSFPHTSCGCFGALAFRIPGTDWLAVMDRSYKGEAPGEMTWSKLANRAGGKQADGVTGIALAYLKSKKAFAADGGLANVKWATRRAYQIMKQSLPADAKVATEETATTLEQLKSVLGG